MMKRILIGAAVVVADWGYCPHEGRACGVEIGDRVVRRKCSEWLRAVTRR